MTPCHFEDKMPKPTFMNLPDEKKRVILRAIREEFVANPIHKASVSNIIKSAGIPRGSFYQYFEDLTDSFFTVLDSEIAESHDLFAKALSEKNGDLFAALETFGSAMADEIFQKYDLYRIRFLFWDCELDAKWRAFRIKNQHKPDLLFHRGGSDSALRIEIMHFLNAVIQKMIERLFTENWDKETFLSHYNQYILWIQSGINVKEIHIGTI